MKLFKNEKKRMKRCLAITLALYIFVMALVFVVKTQETIATIPAYPVVPEDVFSDSFEIPIVEKVFVGSRSQAGSTQQPSGTGTTYNNNFRVNTLFANANATGLAGENAGHSNYLMFTTSDGGLYAGGTNQVGELSVAKNTTVSGRNSFDWWGINSFFKSTQTVIRDAVIGDVVKVDFGHEHSILLDSENNVYTSGNGANGRLGNGGTANQHHYGTPLTFPLNANEDIVDISAAAATGYALTNQGRLFAWGNNNAGQTPGASGGSHNSPVIIPPPAGQAYKMISASHTGGRFVNSSIYAVCVDDSGVETLYSSGLGGNGQLGRGSTANSSAWVNMTYITTDTPNVTAPSDTPFGIKQIEASEYGFLMLRNDGKVFYCGINTAYQSGTGASATGNITRLTEVIMPYDSTGSQMTAQRIFRSPENTWLELNDNQVWGCGDNRSGQLGYYVTNHRTAAGSPTESAYLTNHYANFLVNPVTMEMAAPIAGGANRKLTPAENFDVSSFANGENKSCECIYEDENGDPAPIKDMMISVRTAVIADAQGRLRASGSFYATHRDTSCYIWPGNHKGEPSFKILTWPAPIRNITRVFAGYGTSMTGGTVTNPNMMMFLKENPENGNQSLYVGGRSNLGSSGADIAGVQNPYRFNSPTKVNLSNVEGRIADVSIGYEYTMLLDDLGYVYTCGSNTNGKLGQGLALSASVSRLTRINFSDATLSASGYDDVRITQISASSQTAYAVDDQGNLWGWGLGSEFQLNGNATQARPIVLARAADPQGKVVMLTSSKVIEDTNSAFYIIRENAQGQRTMYSAGQNRAGRLAKGATVTNSALSAVDTRTFITDTGTAVRGPDLDANNILQMEAHSRNIFILVNEQDDPEGTGQVYMTGYSYWGENGVRGWGDGITGGTNYGSFHRVVMPTESTTSTTRLRAERIFRTGITTAIQLTDGMIWLCGTNDHSDLGFQCKGNQAQSGITNGDAGQRGTGIDHDLGYLANPVTLQIAQPVGSNLQMISTMSPNAATYTAAYSRHRTSIDIYQKDGESNYHPIIDLAGGYNESFMVDANGYLRASSDTAIWDTSTFPYMEDNTSSFRRLSNRNREIQDPTIVFGGYNEEVTDAISDPKTITLGPTAYDKLLDVSQNWHIELLTDEVNDVWTPVDELIGDSSVLNAPLVLDVASWKLSPGEYRIVTYRHANMSNSGTNFAMELLMGGAAEMSELASNDVEGYFRIEPEKDMILHLRQEIQNPENLPIDWDTAPQQALYNIRYGGEQYGAVGNMGTSLFEDIQIGTKRDYSEVKPNPIIPQCFFYTGYAYSTTDENLVNDVVTGSGELILDLEDSKEFWVVIYIQPNEALNNSNNGRYSKDNEFGEIFPAP
ncbi:MAG: hypothetical protein FWG82_03435 [Oscillospiraceae bacterium]|nr:hypothetical protein [Oscillospiraceae bacterium]